ncbi:MAG TPA: sulfatase [Candidatus Krumholzibacteria bacterium]|nr:sulfatase [Candidatus Krumholzibacteria bacterium]HRX50163.1 sulfatase [Candidatus Krumholzibacteria bacterium]
MRRRRFLQATAAATALAAAPWLQGCGGGRRPDVYLIIIDSLRADRLGCYGHDRPTSPRLDAFALEAVVYERCAAAAPWTSASVASLLSSQFPSALGIRDRVVKFDTRYASLPEVLRAGGYRTEGLVSVDMLSRRLGFDRGFDRYRDDLYTGREGVTAPQVFEAAAALAREPREQPLFALIHTFDPHYNYIRHADWAGSGARSTRLRSNHPIVELWGMLDRLDADDRAFLLDCYDSEIAFTDAHLGVFLDGLRDAGRYDDSVIIVCADHGEEFLERGWVGHSISVNHEQVHVPLIVKTPGGRPGRTPVPVSLLDVMPSLLGHLGLAAPAGVEGAVHDLSRPDGAVAQPVFSETFHAQTHRPGGMDPIALAAVQLGNRKMIRDGVGGRGWVYDLAADPLERDPLPIGRGSEDQTLLRLISDWSEHVEAKFRGAATQDARRLLDTEQLERLKSLGYI